MTARGLLRSLANYCVQPLDLTLEQKSHVLAWQRRYVAAITLPEGLVRYVASGGTLPVEIGDDLLYGDPVWLGGP